MISLNMQEKNHWTLNTPTIHLFFIFQHQMKRISIRSTYQNQHQQQQQTQQQQKQQQITNNMFTMHSVCLFA